MSDLRDSHVRLDLGARMKFEGSVVDLCSIRLDRLSEEQASHPGTFSWIAVLAAEARRQASHSENNTKQVVASTSVSLREQAHRNANKISEENLKTLVELHPDVIRAKEQQVEAEYRKDIAVGLLDAFKTRKDLIVAMTNDRRSDLVNSD